MYLCIICIFFLAHAREKQERKDRYRGAKYHTYTYTPTLMPARTRPGACPPPPRTPHPWGVGGAGSLLPPPTPYRGVRRGLHGWGCELRKILRQGGGGGVVVCRWRCGHSFGRGVAVARWPGTLRGYTCERYICSRREYSRVCPGSRYKRAYGAELPRGGQAGVACLDGGACSCW